MIAENGTGIVGTAAMIPIHLYIAGRRRLTGKTENLLLDPKYRGTQAFSNLHGRAVALTRERGMSCLWGFTTATRAVRMVGYEIYERVMERPIAVLRPWRAARDALADSQPLRRRLISVARVAALTSYGVTARVSRRFRAGRSGLRRISLEEAPRSKGDLPALYERLRAAYPGLIHIDLDEEYLEWRLFKNPVVTSWAFWAYEGDLLKGYCFATLGKGNIAFLSDLTFETDVAGEACIQGALAALRAQGCTYTDFFGNPQNPLGARSLALVKRYGFRPRQRGSFAAMNTSELDTGDLLDIRNWYLNGMWTEGYR
jgi:hypothetical protein